MPLSYSACVSKSVVDVDDAQVVANVYDQAVIIAFDVEYRLVANGIGAPECLSYLAQIAPGRLACDVAPVYVNDEAGHSRPAEQRSASWTLAPTRNVEASAFVVTSPDVRDLHLATLS